jgi:magnesium transporter
MSVCTVLLHGTSRARSTITGMATTLLYRDGKLVSKDFPVSEISDHLSKDGCMVWADFVSPTQDDLRSIEVELGLHHLAVEDALQDHQRPKIDRYDTHLFLATYAVYLDSGTAELHTSEVKAFITHNAIVTVHEPEFEMSAVEEHWEGNADLSRYGVAFLLWGLLDHIVDGHFEVVQRLDDYIDSLEDALFDDNPRDKEVQRRSFEMRKSLVLLRRVVTPMREVVNTVLRRDIESFDPAMTPYFQDVYDHVLRATEWTESLRDLVTTILETNISIQGNRMNLIMKKVTSWAAIIAVPTAITGFFGQNLNFPGYGTQWGVIASTVFIFVAAAGLYISFRRRDWL